MGEVNIMSDSTLYTIGTALGRAKDQGLTVQVLVEGQWLDGRVAATDGHGLVLAAEGFEQSVIRMQSISAVRVFSAAPTKGARLCDSRAERPADARSAGLGFRPPCRSPRAHDGQLRG